jgi:hypothetical protein
MAILKYLLHPSRKVYKEKSLETMYKDEIKFSYGRLDSIRIPLCFIFIPADRNNHLPGSFIATKYRAMDTTPTYVSLIMQVSLHYKLARHKMRCSIDPI